MSILRVVDSAFNVYSNQYVVTVDILGTKDGEDYTVLLGIPKNKTYTELDFKRYIEEEIKNQKRAAPDFSGLTWKSDQI